MCLRLGLATMLLAGLAQASVIDSGSIIVTLFGDSAVIGISSTDGNFSLTGMIGGGLDQGCFSCPPGVQNQLTFVTASDASLGFGSLTVNGVTYPNIIFNEGLSGFPTSFLSLITDSFEVSVDHLITVPFHASGFIQASLTSGSPDIPLLLNTPVSGVGVVTFGMEEGPFGTFLVTRPVSFVFTPEPSSGLLVAGGLLLAVYLRRRVLRKQSAICS